MWQAELHAPAYKRFEAKRPRIVVASVLCSALLAGLLALVAPPYVPAPYALPDRSTPIIFEEPEMVIPAQPREIHAPEIPVPSDIDSTEEDPSDPGVWSSEVDLGRLAPPPMAVPEQARVVVDRLPVAVHLVQADYPELAAQIGAEGRVVVQVVVEADGRVGCATVVWSDTIAALEIVALEAARQFLFRPAMQGTVAVRCAVEIPFEFALD